MLKAPLSEDQFIGLALGVVLSLWMGLVSLGIHWLMTLF